MLSGGVNKDRGCNFYKRSRARDIQASSLLIEAMTTVYARSGKHLESSRNERPSSFGVRSCTLTPPARRAPHTEPGGSRPSPRAIVRKPTRTPRSVAIKVAPWIPEMTRRLSQGVHVLPVDFQPLFPYPDPPVVDGLQIRPQVFPSLDPCRWQRDLAACDFLCPIKYDGSDTGTVPSPGHRGTRKAILAQPTSHQPTYS